MQEPIARSIVVAVSICERPIVESVVVDPVRDSLHGPRSCQCADVLCAVRRGHMGGPRLRSQFGGSVSIYGEEEEKRRSRISLDYHLHFIAVSGFPRVDGVQSRGSMRCCQ